MLSSLAAARIMNPFQKIILMLGIAIAVVVGLFPPWDGLISGNGHPPVPYRSIFSHAPIVGGSIYRVNVKRLVTRVFIVFGTTVILFLTAGLIRVGQHHDNAS